jgi:hypothetical protein
MVDRSSLMMGARTWLASTWHPAGLVATKCPLDHARGQRALRVADIKTIAHRRRAEGKLLLPEDSAAADRVPKCTPHKDVRHEVSR